MEKCIICGTPHQPLISAGTGNINNTELMGDNSIIVEQIEVFFLVTKLMEIPLDICTHFLSTYGNPSTWLFYCGKCSLLIKKYRKTYDKLIILQKTFNLLKKQLKICVEEANNSPSIADDIQTKTNPVKPVSEYILNLYLNGDQKFPGFKENSPKERDHYDDATVSAEFIKEEIEDYPSSEVEDNVIDNFHCDTDSTGKMLPSPIAAAKSTDECDLQMNVNVEDDFPQDGSRFSCDYCGKDFKHKSTMLGHTRRFHTKEPTHACEKCGEWFPDRKDVLRHFAKAHPDEVPIKRKRIVAKRNMSERKTIVCEICGRHCNDDSTFKVHMRIHTGDKPYLCEICSVRFHTVTELSWHKQATHYKELKVEPFQCKECGKYLGSPPSLEYHMKAHHGKKDVLCNICGARFVDKFKLKDHIMIQHENQKNFECGQCGQKLSRKQHIDEHRQKHSGKYDHVCQVCQKGFTRKSYLKRHMKYHSSDYPRKRKSRLKNANKTNQ